LNRISERMSQMSRSWWVAVKFQEQMSSADTEPIGFCEAVHKAREKNVSLSFNNVCCDGARRCFGWLKDSDIELAKRLSRKTAIDHDAACELIKGVPVLNENIAGISLGAHIQGDVYISYASPESAMKVIRDWQKLTSQNPRVDISSFMSVCGNVAVRSYLGQCISISFGCPDSREYGGIEKGQLVIGIPYNIASKLYDTGGKAESIDVIETSKAQYRFIWRLM
jgi:uncharacterized protein (DUF169 family)